MTPRQHSIGGIQRGDIVGVHGEDKREQQPNNAFVTAAQRIGCTRGWPRCSPFEASAWPPPSSRRNRYAVVILYRLPLRQTEVRLLESTLSTICRRRIGLLSVSRAIQGQSSQQVTDHGAEKSAPKHHPPEIRKPLADEEIHCHWL